MSEKHQRGDPIFSRFWTSMFLFWTRFWRFEYILDVTGPSGTAKSTNFGTLTCSEILSKIRSNLTWQPEHVCSEVPARNQSQKVTRRRPREQERKTAIPAASAAILTFFHGIVPISDKIPLLL